MSQSKGNAGMDCLCMSTWSCVPLNQTDWSIKPGNIYFDLLLLSNVSSFVFQMTVPGTFCMHNMCSTTEWWKLLENISIYLVLIIYPRMLAERTRLFMDSRVDPKCGGSFSAKTQHLMQISYQRNLWSGSAGIINFIFSKHTFLIEKLQSYLIFPKKWDFIYYL